MVETTFNYLAEMAERPAYYFYPPPEGVPWRNTRGDRRPRSVENARLLSPPADLDREGFALIVLASQASDLYDADTVRTVYFPEVEEAVRRHTGARRVVAFDHNVRNGSREGRSADSVQGPVRFAHNDYTERSGPQRVRDLFPDEAPALLARRFAVINVWKPIRGPVAEAPLAVCDARTIAAADWVETDLRYRERTGEVYSLRFNPAHCWFYYPHMQADEAMLLKCYDSESGRARFTAHSAFDDPTSPDDAPPRESIEVRTFAFF